MNHNNHHFFTFMILFHLSLSLFSLSLSTFCFHIHNWKIITIFSSAFPLSDLDVWLSSFTFTSNFQISLSLSTFTFQFALSLSTLTFVFQFTFNFPNFQACCSTEWSWCPAQLFRLGQGQQTRITLARLTPMIMEPKVGVWGILKIFSLQNCLVVEFLTQFVNCQVKVCIHFYPILLHWKNCMLRIA